MTASQVLLHYRLFSSGGGVNNGLSMADLYFQLFYLGDDAPLLGILIKYFSPLYFAPDHMMERIGGIYSRYPWHGVHSDHIGPSKST